MNNVINIFEINDNVFDNLSHSSQVKLNEIWFNDFNKTIYIYNLENDLDNVYNFNKGE